MQSPIFHAKKKGALLDLKRDPHPGTTRYLVIEAPGLLVLFPQDGRASDAKESHPANDIESPLENLTPEFEAPDRDAHLLRAFQTLRDRTNSSQWATSSKPFSDLTDCFRALAAQEQIAKDVDAYLKANPSVGNSIEMLFTSVSMSARAQWHLAPAHIRGVVARGWFLGRWLPTFLVLDGPIRRFLNSPAFKHQSQPPSTMLRAVRRFFDIHDFMLLRHAFAHWAFRWEVSDGDSIIVGTNDANTETARVTRAEADAFHIITFALIEVLNDVFLHPHREAHKQE